MYVNYISLKLGENKNVKVHGSKPSETIVKKMVSSRKEQRKER